MKALDANTLAALEAGQFAVRGLCLFDLPSGRWGMFDDAYDLSWDGDTYIGAAGRFTMQIPPGAADLSVRGLTVTISSLDTSALAWVSSQEYHQRPMFAALAFIAPETPQVVSVRKWFTGFVDTVQWQERIGATGTLIVNCESASRELDRAGARTRTDADQRSRDASDGFFKFTTAAISTEIEWGSNVPQQTKKSWWQKLF